MSKYIRLTKGLNDKGILIKPEEIYERIDDLEKDHYVSTYFYNEEQYNHFQKTGSVAGIRDVKTDKIWWDFDDKNPEHARLDAIEVIDRLKTAGYKDENIEVYFSGGKGYHVILQTNRLLTPEQVQSIAINKFGKDLKTLDSSLYDSNQILRLPFTKHNQTKCYKTPITIENIKKLTTNDIKTIASDYESLPGPFDTKPANLSEELLEVPKKKETVKREVVSSDIDWTRRPRHWRDYKWSLLHAVALKPGERSNAMIVLASTCRALGYDEEMTRGLLTSFDKKYASTTDQEENETEIENKINSVFSEKWQGGQYTPEQNAWLAEYCQRVGLKQDKSEVTQLSDINEQFKHFVKHIDENTIKTGIAKLDKEVPITVGMNLGILGAPSAGKTAIALEILKNTSQAGIVTVMASLDMHRNRLFEKLLYKVSGGMSREELYKLYQEDREQELFDKVKEEYGNVYFYDRSSPTVQDIREYTEEVEHLTGKKVKLVMIDYFERVTTDVSEDTAASKKIAGQLQDFINDMNIAMITLVQPNKMSLAAGPDTEIKSYTAIKGSSFLYQSFRSIIALWRPFFTPSLKHMDRFLEMAILKNDLGELNKFIFSWVGKTGAILEPTVEDLEMYAAFMSEKNARMNNEGGNDEWS